MKCDVGNCSQEEHQHLPCPQTCRASIPTSQVGSKPSSNRTNEERQTSNRVGLIIWSTINNGANTLTISYPLTHESKESPRFSRGVSPLTLTVPIYVTFGPSTTYSVFSTSQKVVKYFLLHILFYTSVSKHTGSKLLNPFKNNCKHH